MSFTVAVIGACIVFGCSDDLTVPPSATPEEFGAARAPALTPPVPGSYTLRFHNLNFQSVTTLPAGSGLASILILDAYVQDSDENPAQKGGVRFQICQKGRTRGVITDAAPSVECENGEAHWTDMINVNVGNCIQQLGTGNACFEFCCVSIPRTISFRYMYVGQGSGIPNGVGGPEDFTWY